MTMTCYNPRLAIDLGQTSGRTARQLMAPEANTPSEGTLRKIEKEGPQLMAVLPPGPVCPGLRRNVQWAAPNHHINLRGRTFTRNNPSRSIDRRRKKLRNKQTND